MANEAELRLRQEDPIDFTVADNVGIEKGSLLTLHDPRAASGATVGGLCAGIARREKISGDGRTRLAVFRKGIFDVHASGAVVLGQNVQMAESNDVMLAATGASGAVIIGTALETAANDETFQIQLNL